LDNYCGAVVSGAMILRMVKLRWNSCAGRRGTKKRNGTD